MGSRLKKWSRERWSRLFALPIEPYKASAKGEPKSARQVIFLVSAGHETCDLLYHAPDGLRGRYWQSPDHGLLATRYLIGNLLPTLAAFADRNPPIARRRPANLTNS
jgi:hypothetical protein